MQNEQNHNGGSKAPCSKTPSKSSYQDGGQTENVSSNEDESTTETGNAGLP